MLKNGRDGRGVVAGSQRCFFVVAKMLEPGDVCVEVVDVIFWKELRRSNSLWQS